MSDANGCTTSEVPITISRSAFGKSTMAHSKKRAGSCSPKKTMSGLTRPPYLAFSARHFSSPSKSIASFSSSTGTSVPAPFPNATCAPSKLPCAATTASFGSPAAVSSAAIEYTARAKAQAWQAQPKVSLRESARSPCAS